MPYRVRVIKDEDFDRAVRMMMRKVEEGEDYAVYEGEGDIWLSQETLSMDEERFIKFYKKMRVQNGKKELKFDQIHLSPLRRRAVAVRLSRAEYLLLKNIAPEGETLTEFIRSIILETLRNYVYEKQYKKEMQNQP